MKFKYGDIIKLKDFAKPRMSLDANAFFSLFDDENAQVKTYWGLPEDAFDIDNCNVYLKSEYAKRLYWGVDEVISSIDKDILNINVAFDPEGNVNCGAFCSYISEDDVKDDL